MEKELISTGHTWETDYPFHPELEEREPGWTQIAKVKLKEANLIFIAGQCAWDDLGRIVVPDDMEAQLPVVYQNVKDALEAAGAKAADIVYERANVVKGYMPAFRKMAPPVRKKFYADGGATRFPPFTLIGVDRLAHGDVQLEVEVIAVTSTE